jgi:hypothetical protein
MPGRRIVPTGRRSLLIAALAAVVLAGVIVALLWPSSKPSCTIEKSGAASCGVWWGSALNANDSQLRADVGARETATKRRLDIVHTYHRWYDNFPTANEMAVAKAGRMLYLNWEPVDKTGQAMSWHNIAVGQQDHQIDLEAARLKAVPTTVMLSFSHEPELDYKEHGSVTDFAAAFRHVNQRLTADGVTNVRYVWNVMGLSDPVWLSRYKQMWPGNDYVDWIAWDPYNWSDCRTPADPWLSFSQVISPFYQWLESNGFGDKPFMLGEWGTVEQTGNPQGKQDWFGGVPGGLKAMPNMKAVVYFDLPHPPANCNWQITTSAAASKGYGVLAQAHVFADTAKVKLLK